MPPLLFSHLRPTHPAHLALGLGITSLGTILFTRYLYTQLQTPPSANLPKPIDSPVKRILQLSKEEQDKLAYGLNALPGARDVETPYGSIRVYEWGPSDGEKVLFIHGISTPSIAFGNIAPELVSRGYRVMLFDLFGRGHTSAPLTPYTTSLYTAQIHLVLSSSALSWRSFHLIGYSLGGCIAASFAQYHAHLIRSLVLIAPAGLLRYSAMSLRTRVLYHPWVQALLPRGWRDAFVRGRLWSRVEERAVVGDGVGNGEAESEAVVARDDTDLAPSSSNIVSSEDCNRAVNESLLYHAGLPHAFISSLQYAPIYEQDEEWRKLECRVLMILGERDPIIKVGEVRGRFEGIVPEERRRVVVLDAGHEVPVSRAGECVRECVGFWEEREGER